jgi:hypothetical protein
MIFSLAIQPIILSLHSQLNIWYLYDGTFKGVAKGGARWARPTPESFWPTPE